MFRYIPSLRPVEDVYLIMSYFLVSSDKRTVLEYRSDNKMLGEVDFADIEPGSHVITRSSLSLKGEFADGFDECDAMNMFLVAAVQKVTTNFFKSFGYTEPIATDMTQAQLERWERGLPLVEPAGEAEEEEAARVAQQVYDPTYSESDMDEED
jgi:hypothetical protein